MRPFLPAALLLLGFAAHAQAETVPDLDVEKTCRSSQIADPSVNDKASYEGCLRSEKEAKRQAEQHWSSYAPAAKRQCEAQFKAGGYPSYVEMVTCLELATGVVPGQNSNNTAVGGNGTPKSAGAEGQDAQNLTKEPSPGQRTNPIKVLKRD